MGYAVCGSAVIKPGVRVFWRFRNNLCGPIDTAIVAQINGGKMELRYDRKACISAREVAGHWFAYQPYSGKFLDRLYVSDEVRFSDG